MKKILICLFCICFLGAVPSFSKISAMSAVVTTDLHYTKNSGQSPLIIPGMAHADEITQALIDQVISLKPDVFIMTGDNTNSGAPADCMELALKLQQVRDAGIQIILTTGNHDFDRSDPADFEDCYSDLIDPLDRDPDSLSYVAMSDGVVFFAMDDSSLNPEGEGQYSPASLSWLREMLEKYSAYPMVYLSHHSTLNFAGEGERNSALAGLLKEYGVKLLLSGHYHSQNLLELDGMYELTGAMPLSAPHTLGLIEIRGGTADYHTLPIDFAKYGAEGLAEKLSREEEERGRKQAESFRALLQGGSPEETEGMLNLLTFFLKAYTEGMLGDSADRILNDPYYEKMIDALWDDNYGPWIKAVLENQPKNSAKLTVTGLN